jgi:dihydroflavonol-4-reductase
VAGALLAAGADVRGDRVELLDTSALERALAGCDAVVHTAALYSYGHPLEQMQRVNVEGTRNVLDACRRRGVRRLVHTSTCGTCGPVRGRVATEQDAPPSYALRVPYKQTKLAAERLVLEAAARGLDAVVVNPTTIIGEGDGRPTPTGRMVSDVATGRIRAFVATTGLNVVDVRDVAQGHVLALERGRSGERYLLGGANWTLEQLFARIAAAAGLKAPSIRLPYGLARAAGMVGLANSDEVLLAQLPMFFSHQKAARDLGYRPAEPGPAIERAVAFALARRDPTGDRVCRSAPDSPQATPHTLSAQAPGSAGPDRAGIRWPRRRRARSARL